jgi:putative ABC transport system permease protein
MFHADADRDRLVDQRGLNVMVDESGARRLGFASAQAALGRQVSRDTDDGHAVAPYTIVGIVNDAHFESARFESMPKLYFVVPTGHAALAMRLAGAGAASVPSRLEALWKANAVAAPFKGFFADSRIADMYKSDERRARTFAVFAAFAILISCLGLFALAAFAAERRTKEIGIRKVFGARTRDIVGLLSWQFLRPVLIANLIAWPIAWWAMQSWLNDFHTRIVIGPTPFVLAALLAILIAAGTIVGHAVRVARMNPIHALRYE